MRIIDRMVQELRDSIELSRYHANELAELLEDTNESVTTSTQRKTNIMTLEQQKLVVSLIAEEMEKHAKLSLDPLHKRSIKRVELLCATLAAFNELTNPQTKEREKAEAIEIARIAINAIETIYGHAQWCGQCQSFEIAKQCRDELHGFDRLNSLENDGLIQEASDE